MEHQRVALLIPVAVRSEDDERARRDEGPRRDYFELARAVQGEIVDETRLATEHDRTITLARRWLGPGFAYSLWAYRHRHEYRAFYADSERIGFPLAALLKRANAKNHVVMIGHWLSPWKKRAIARLLRLHTHIDRIICHIELQCQCARSIGIPDSKLALVPYGVDHRFWRPTESQNEDIFCAVGLERRDYSTLIEAVRGSPFRTVLAAASPWFDVAGVNCRTPLPDNVRVGKFDYVRLRELYARSRFVVVPLFDVDFQAGITSVLEAMAMAKAVIVTRTRGQIDAGVISHGTNGLLVPPANVDAMRQAITSLWDHPAISRRMGRESRRLVEEQWTLDGFASRIGEIITDTLQT